MLAEAPTWEQGSASTQEGSAGARMHWAPCMKRVWARLRRQVSCSLQNSALCWKACCTRLYCWRSQ